jgi:DNA polymerase III epsilon subunit-like protein
MDFRERQFAVVDIETTGDDELKHEILEVGLLVVRQKDFEIVDTTNRIGKALKNSLT